MAGFQILSRFWPRRLPAEPANSSMAALFKPVDNSFLVYFRLIFGAIMLWEVWRYFTKGWIARYYIDPTFHFTYVGFEWITPWPGNGMYIHFAVLGVLAVCIMAGFWYRAATALFFMGFTYVFLLDQVQYLNHFYLISLISFLMIFLPAHRAFSIDAKRNPELRSQTTPTWTLWLLRAQLGIAYFFGGVAKLNADWLNGEPMRMWLSERTDFPLIGSLFTKEWMVYQFVYGGLLFDLLIAPFLLWRRTRLPACVAAIAFHLLNNNLFRIGIFPWFMLAATLVFFPPDVPRRIARFLTNGWQAKEHSNADANPLPDSGSLQTRSRIVALLAIYLAVQLLMPLRHFLYPGNVSWTEQGHNFSWHMKLRDKNGTAKFFATDPVSQKTWEIKPRRYLSSRQVSKMSGNPDMILQFSHFLAEDLRKQGHENIELRVLALASLNGRKSQLLVDPTVNLAVQERNLLPAAWIMPLVETLQNQPSPSS